MPGNGNLVLTKTGLLSHGDVESLISSTDVTAGTGAEGTSCSYRLSFVENVKAPENLMTSFFPTNNWMEGLMLNPICPAIDLSIRCSNEQIVQSKFILSAIDK